MSSMPHCIFGFFVTQLFYALDMTRSIMNKFDKK